MLIFLLRPSRASFFTHLLPFILTILWSFILAPNNIDPRLHYFL